MTGKKPTAIEKRYAALGVICHNPTFVCPETRYATINSLNLPILVAEIRELASLGRTERWKASVENWAQMLLADPHCDDWSKYLNWAFLQGSVYVGFECE